MQNLEVHKGKHLLRNTIGTIISASLLAGCNLNSKPVSNDSVVKSTPDSSQEYCINGGKSNKYSCDPELTSPQVKLHNKEVDDEWMQAKLAEIKKWMAEEKQSLAQGKAKQPTISEGSIAATKQDNEYLTTVSTNNSTIGYQLSPEIENILRLSQQGHHQEALAGINSFMAANPKTPSAELTKGIILSNMGDKQAAKVIFQRLTRNHPDRPEAFNNLAVIYAEEGKYPEAIETLQSAFQTHPSYAQVHSNLKELYATLASQAYNKALDLGTGNSGPELAMINQAPSKNGSTITVVSASKVKSPTNSKPPSAVSEKTPEPQQAQKPATVEQTVETSSAQKPIEPIKAKPPAVEVAATTPASKVEPTAPAAIDVKASEGAKVEPAQAAQLHITKQVESHLLAWASAWRSQDHLAYINAYTNNYRPNTKLSHNQWVQQRKVRLNKPKFIKVELSNISIELLRDNLAEVRFDQNYQSNTYSDSVKKRVMMVKTNGQWKISLERSLGLIY
ncbi:tetratricopeptide repeat protein [Neptuniibacter sp.]|uniref:L,D-transpeptidase Cds6 family protein n=1 Tax=Neptuniibacter sp. TaxID=1962643 RepID=UPI002607D9D8|nr:tetratricopeptide repeat protein [Neptuniibacter sp.]MCP4598302.1 tetratricopeptide repeat protein [Neptuniibacter sp.]